MNTSEIKELMEIYNWDMTFDNFHDLEDALSVYSESREDAEALFTYLKLCDIKNDQVPRDTMKNFARDYITDYPHSEDFITCDYVDTIAKKDAITIARGFFGGKFIFKFRDDYIKGKQ